MAPKLHVMPPLVLILNLCVIISVTLKTLRTDMLTRLELLSTTALALNPQSEMQLVDVSALISLSLAMVVARRNNALTIWN
jgi:hypothetical protein